MTDPSNRRSLPARLFLITSVLGSLYLALEAVLQSFGRSICATAGCRVVAQYSRYGDLSFVLGGLAVMVLLALLALRIRRKEHAGTERMINAVLTAALAAEGFLVGYQLLWLRTVCVFCISVFALVVVLAALRAAAGHREALPGFGALAAVLLLFTLLLPAGGTALPKDAQRILFYSDDCRHCAEIRKEIEEQRIEVLHAPVREYAATLRNMGIEEVPTLLVNGPYEKTFLTGTAAIRRYLATCRTSPTEPGRRRPSTKRNPASIPPSPVPLNLLPSTGTPGLLQGLPQDNGICRDEQKCE